MLPEPHPDDIDDHYYCLLVNNKGQVALTPDGKLALVNLIPFVMTGVAPELDDHTLVSYDELKGLTGLSRSAIKRAVARGPFEGGLPRPSKKGHFVRWRFGDVKEWVEANKKH